MADFVALLASLSGWFYLTCTAWIDVLRLDLAGGQ
jgi:hypothetical protein